MPIEFTYKDEIWCDIAESVHNIIIGSKRVISEKFIIVPLFEFDSNKNEIIPSGLEIVKELRQKDRFDHAIFLVTSKYNVPYIFQQEKHMHVESIAIIKNPYFNNTYKAVFLVRLS